MKKIRQFLWRILGIDYQQILNKLDYVLLKNDRFSKLGTGTYDNGAKVWRWTNAELTVGNYCSIANNVNFIVDEGYHKGSAITSYPFINDKNTSSTIKIKQKEGINIGNDVWIGMGAFIMPGVKIGNGVTIAANAVVTNDVSDYMLVAGSPARVIKEKCNPDQIQALNSIAWWHWPKEKIKANTSDFYNLSINQFIEKYAN